MYNLVQVRRKVIERILLSKIRLSLNSINMRWVGFCQIAVNNSWLNVTSREWVDIMSPESIWLQLCNKCKYSQKFHELSWLFDMCINAVPEKLFIMHFMMYQ